MRCRLTGTLPSNAFQSKRLRAGHLPDGENHHSSFMHGGHFVTDAIRSYFAQPGPTTELGAYADLVSELPSSPEELARVVRGLVIHEGLVAPAGLDLPPDRFTDRERVGAASIVQRVLDLDPSPLISARQPGDRMVGYCYHFAVLHCALLRAKGVPSRARCGFAAYLRDGAWIDHWVVEFWDGDGWVLIDPDSARDGLSSDDFRHAGSAWQLCRAGVEDPSRHGNYEFWGWDELRGSLVADIGSLNRVEVGDWEPWCDWIAIDQKDQPNAKLDAHLDTLAELISDDGPFDELQRVFREDDRLRPPAAAT
jgi:hypothetical protein